MQPASGGNDRRRRGQDELVREESRFGLDGQSIKMFEANLEQNLMALMRHLKTRGAYQPRPARRRYIDKGGGKQRPLGIPTVRDRVAQEVLRRLLTPLFEPLFHDDSFGFRPGRSCHDALRRLRELHRQGYRQVLDADISGFFDTLDHAPLREFLQRRVRDGVLRRLIGKWLKAGGMEEGDVSYLDAGSPQGGVILPLLANVYLHYVLDLWFEHVVKPRLQGKAYLVRYADDFVIGFTREEDARRVMDVLPKRFGKYGLAIHPDKTRLIPFHRPARRSRGKGADGKSRPGTFDILRFTHYWGRSRKGNWVVKQKTASGRLSRAVQRVAPWCRRNRHRPVREQHRTLSQKVRGHYAYYGVTGNARSLAAFHRAVQRCWRKWLNRRHRKRTMNWDKFTRLLKRYPLPPIRVVHSVYGHAAKL